MGVSCGFSCLIFVGDFGSFLTGATAGIELLVRGLPVESLSMFGKVNENKVDTTKYQWLQVYCDEVPSPGHLATVVTLTNHNKFYPV